MKKEAMLFSKKEGLKVQCQLCGHTCVIENGSFGICGVRENEHGILYTHTFGELIAAHIDPIEKKPLYHFLPGSRSLSIATPGCNFKCDFCQNWQISQHTAEDFRTLGLYPATPEQLVRKAKRENCESISYTYTEPTIYFEYAYEIAKLARKENLYNVFVTNGFMSRDAIETIHPFLDASNVDLKSFRDSFYKNICKGRLKVVLDSIELMKKLNIWVEITTLIVPELNDSEEELKDIAAFIAHVGKDIPWHISRFHGDYKLSGKGYTSLKTMQMARELGREAGLRYVYLGNISAEENNTYCSSCKKLLIDRSLYVAGKNTIKDSACPQCNTKIEGVWR
ncbi:MAG: AmmeMemoRadiSam system radical SAM enzyme [bacterium]